MNFDPDSYMDDVYQLQDEIKLLKLSYAGVLTALCNVLAERPLVRSQLFGEQAVFASEAELQVATEKFQLFSGFSTPLEQLQARRLTRDAIQELVNWEKKK